MSMLPNLKGIRGEKELIQSGKAAYASWFNGTYVHPKPRFYKYYWWVFWSGSPVDGRAFLSAQYRLCIASAMQLIGELKERGEPTWVYNDKLPRRDPANPFRQDATKWKEWAVSYDEDPDPIIMSGPMKGHR